MVFRKAVSISSRVSTVIFSASWSRRNSLPSGVASIASQAASVASLAASLAARRRANSITSSGMVFMLFSPGFAGGILFGNDGGSWSRHLVVMFQNNLGCPYFVNVLVVLNNEFELILFEIIHADLFRLRSPIGGIVGSLDHDGSGNLVSHLGFGRVLRFHVDGFLRVVRVLVDIDILGFHRSREG